MASVDVTGFLDSMKGTLEVCGHDFKVRTVSACLYISFAMFSCMAANMEQAENLT